MTTQPNRSSVSETPHLGGQLKERTARAVLITLMGHSGQQVVRFAITTVLARLLLPTDYGLIAMVAAFTGVISVFRDMGLAAATVQRKDITYDQVNALFWLNVAVGVLLTLVAVGIAPLVASFYQEGQLLSVCAAMGFAFFINGASVQHRALMQRSMRFRALAIVDMLSVLLSGVTAIVMAWMGTGFWALVGQRLALSLVALTGLWIACEWRPSRPRWDRTAMAMLTFGGQITANNAVNYFARSADKMLLGRRWGQEATGLYSKAYSLLLLPIDLINGPITAVIVPALSRLQDQHKRYWSFYLNTLAFVLLVTTPLVVFLSIVSQEVVVLLLGKQWLAAAPLFRRLAPAALARVICNTASWLYISSGRTRRLVQWTAVGTVVSVASFAIGLSGGALGLASAYSAAMVAMVVPCIWYATAGTGISVSQVLRRFAPPLVSAAVGYAACWLYAAMMPEWHIFVNAGIKGVLFFLSYFGVLWYGFRTSRTYVSFGVRLLKRKGGVGQVG